MAKKKTEIQELSEFIRDHMVTKDDLQEGLADIRKEMATKNDVAALGTKIEKLDLSTSARLYPSRCALQHSRGRPPAACLGRHATSKRQPAFNGHRSSRASTAGAPLSKTAPPIDSSTYQEATTINLVPAFQEK